MKTRLLFLSVFLPAISSYLSAAEPDPGFVAHEWGTFTSVQGADGVQLVWNPFVAPELPKFVYDSIFGLVGARPPGPGLLLKSSIPSRQRMETPVIYFYSDRARTVDVAIKFPEGLVTEWYPRKSPVEPAVLPVSDLRPSQPIYMVEPDPAPRVVLPVDPAPPLALHWKNLQVLAKGEKPNEPLPVDPSGSHYYAARETDASLLRVEGGADKKAEVEKFLFYRGVASFQAPLTVKAVVADPKCVVLTNTGAAQLRHLFIYEVRDSGGVWLTVDKLDPGETRTVRLDAESGAQPLTAADRSLDKAVPASAARLCASLVGALVSEGLYEREAVAMVKTWESSWLSEKGMRVLYTLPRTWTDQALPLAITPAPREVERVMVARAEIITPEMEQKLVSQIERYISADAASRPQIAAETGALGFGRFIQPILARVLLVKRGEEFEKQARQLVQAASLTPAVSLATTAAR